MLRAAFAAACAVLGLGSASVPPAVATGTPSPAAIQKQEWWLVALGVRPGTDGAPTAWQITKGRGVTVAVIDYGVDATVPDLSGALVPGFSTSGSLSPDQAHQARGHGTAMAVEIAGRGKGPGILGIAPEAKIMPVYLAGDLENDTVSGLKRITAMTHPPAIVNMSYGLGGTCPPDVQSAVADAAAKGIILVSSAGNSGNLDNTEQFPADCKGVVAVGAFDPSGKPWVSTQRQPYVSLGGPGVDIVSYDRARVVADDYQGTSDASAIVSGELALLRSHWPTMSSRQLVAKMFATTAKHTYSGPGYGSSEDVLGYGIGVVNAALRDNVPANAPNPVYDSVAKLFPKQGGSSDPSPSSGSPDPTSRSEASGTPPPATVTQGFPGSHNASGSGSGGHTGLIIGIVGGIVVILLIVLAVVFGRRRGARAGPVPRG